ncbi:alkaline phosphatase family protein [Planctobacterium marinum]|uniref:Alkaline phosphatase family protein n=1 Tax=Planctobacterium marinum TaxID=1631968 RepID=A0AA48KNC9_9ALTE|nr:alkaline phosphatase family protein [Planctobacterium marinum]
MKILFAKTLLTLCALLVSTAALADKPKLVVQITVDQLRGDLLFRYQDNFLNSNNNKGFNRFLRDGTIFTNAHYRHAATLTAVGHATLATGAIPSQHGLIGNNWYDVAGETEMYCVADKDTKILQGEGKSASPKNLMASTFSDELHFATNGKAKIYSVSVKDRGAVLTGGQFGKSFWMDKNSGNFVTSSWYYDAMPDWAKAFNEGGLKDSWVGAQWTLSKPESVYINSTENRIYQIPPRGFSRGFPHGLPEEANKNYYKALNMTPFADELTAEFAKHITAQNALGKDEVTDFLAISFSLNDYIGHNYGPFSREAEDGLYQLDAVLADLFNFLDEQVGLEHVLLTLSADHGVDAIPEYKKSLGFAGLRGDVSSKLKQFVKGYAEEKDIDGELLSFIRLPNIYLNHSTIKSADLDLEDVLEDFAEELASYEEIGAVYTSEDLAAGTAKTDPVSQQISNNFVAERSGDLIVVQKTSTMLGNYSAATHGSPYKYDTHVPVYFTGWKVKPQRLTRLVSPEDIAVTLSATLNIGYPDKSTGSVLAEIAELP